MRDHLAALLLVCAGMTGGAARAAHSDKMPLTVAAAIETTRILPTTSRFGLYTRFHKKNDVLVSRDGSRYAVMLVRGDVQNDRVIMELVTGQLNSLEDAVRYRRVGPFFTRGFGPFPLTYRFDYRIMWVDDNRRVAFVTEAPDGTDQVALADVTTGESKFITRSDSNVGIFDISQRGDLVFSVHTKPSAQLAAQLIRDGFAVTEIDARGLMSGFPNESGRETFRHMLGSVLRDATPREIEFAGGTNNLIPPQLIRFSPDGRRAILDSTPPAQTIPASWGRYTDPTMGTYAREAQQPGGGRTWIIKRLYVLDVERGYARPLFDAPKTFVVNEVAWSPDSRFVALGPTFLPPERASKAGLDGTAIAIVNVENGTYEELDVPPKDGPGWYVAAWRPDGILEIRNGNATLRYHRADRHWQLMPETGNSAPIVPRVQVAVREDMNTPPQLWAADPALREERFIMDLNPGLLERYSLGAVETVEWQDGEGRRWRGRLYYPVGYRRGVRYAVVLQLARVAPVTQFSLYGAGASGYAPGLGPPGSSIYAAQALANRSMAVLHIDEASAEERRAFSTSPKEPQVYQAACESAARFLVDRGLADPRKIGLAGFSRSGWYVEYAVSHSSFPFGAAVASDNFTGGYLQAALIGAAGGLTGEFAQDNGAPGIGEGLSTWLKTAPAFNAHRVRTPLRLQVESGGLKNAVLHWEMFNALSLLQKPVELFVVPDIERGAHNLQNPRQILASAEGTVDWFDFWLNGREDPDQAKAAQYARWRELRSRHSTPAE